MREVQIADLDGCLADDRWRRALIRPEPSDRGVGWQDKFVEYHQASWRDTVENLSALREGCDLVILTGRPLWTRPLTLAWLAEVAGLDPLHVIFRNNSDHRPSVEVKREQLGWLLTNYGIRRERIVEAIDDMEPIVEMYRTAGLTARVVRIGEEQHAHG